MAGRYQFDTHLTEIGLKKRLCKNSLEGPVPVVPLLFIDYHLFVDQGLNRFKSIYSKMINEKVLHIMLEKEFVSSVSANYMKTCIMNNLIVIESLTIVNSLNKVQFPFVKVFPPQMLSSSSEGATVQAVPIAFAPVH